ncbi:MAG: lipopolysaccharide heptosyltransferase II [Nitrospira sp.]|nr:lipopolysaccharide heptosyltransferase II [Nitrospira sp.]
MSPVTSCDATSSVLWDTARILLIKPSSLGDIVHTFPVVSAIKAEWPGVHVTWVVKRQWAEFVERAEGVDRVWPIDMTVNSWVREGLALRAERFDFALDLQGLFRSGVLAWFSGAPIRVGFANAREGSSWFYTNPVPVAHPNIHAVDRYLSLVGALGGKFPEKPQFQFKFMKEDVATVRAICQRQGFAVDRPWIAMNMGARWATKRWPLKAFAAVLDQLHASQVGPVVIIGNSDERRYTSQLRVLTSSPFIDLCGEISLRHLPALLSTASTMVTNDSGPMHIAAALQVPVVAMFGPTSATRTGPYGNGHRVLTGQVPCSPCFSRVCRHVPELECLHLITPTQVVDAIRPRLTAHASCQ